MREQNLDLASTYGKLRGLDCNGIIKCLFDYESISELLQAPLAPAIPGGVKDTVAWAPMKRVRRNPAILEMQMRSGQISTVVSRHPAGVRARGGVAPPHPVSGSPSHPRDRSPFGILKLYYRDARPT